MPQPEETSVDRLKRALKGARRAWWRSALERTAVVALIVAAVVPIVAWPVRWWTGASGPATSAAHLTSTLGAMAAAVLLTAVVLLIVHASRAPSLLELARRCDRILDQKQRISTAYEVAERSGSEPPSIVSRLLLADVDARLTGLDLNRAVRRPTPRPLLTSLLAVAVTAGLALALPVPQPAPVVEAPPTAPTTAPAEAAGPDLTPDSAEETAALAEAIAEQLAAEPVAQRDPFLRAVAEGFADLASQLSEDAISVAEADQIVEDLLAFLDDAVERTGGSLADVVQEAMPAGIDRGSGEDSNATIPGIGSEASEEDGRAAAEVNDDRPLEPSASQGDGSALERLASALERRAEERAANAPEGEAELFGPDGRNPYGEQVNVVRESTGEAEPGAESLLRAEAAGAGRAAGAAQQSSDGAGDAAGGGSAELIGEENDFGRDDAQVEVTPIEAGDQAEGRRIESSFAPTEGAGWDRDVTEAPEARAFDRSAESATPSKALGWTHRDVVSRYFLPRAAPPASPNP